MSALSTARPIVEPLPVDPDRYSDLIRHGCVAGHDAGPDDYDAAMRDAAAVYAWSVRHGYDLCAAMAKGMMTALTTIDPRDRPPY
jgi:hypothetical protein